jgi:CheY-like chemotaxis protein
VTAALKRTAMPRTVLIADDNPTIRKMLCRIFEQEKDYDLCAEATNGLEAISLAQKHKPELIILDVSMPVMDGLQAARKLKEIMPHIPIILFTQHADAGLEKLVSDIPVELIVSKNDAAKLLGHVRDLIPV